ncbi:MAG: CAP domain-containing protein [Planctomycetaceae bacterium]|jgi:uncharacterized protein YkwD|nr:CAP domain-containing protein [Planctomycetaceae bacterium]
MNGKLIVAVFVVFVLGYVLSRSPDPTPDVMANDYATTIATVATVAAYESLSPPKEVVQYPVEDSVVNEVVQEVAEQMEALSESSEPVTIPVSQTVETEIVPIEPVAPVENPLDDTEIVAWEKLNDMRVAAGLKRLVFVPELVDGCRKHANDQRKRRTLWHASNRDGCGENCAVSDADIIYNKTPLGERPIGQWMRSTDHRKFMLSRSITEGAIARSGDYWVFRAKSAPCPTKTVTIVEDTGKTASDESVTVKEKSVQNSCTGNSCTTGYASDGQRTVKTYSRTGRHRPLRYALWRTFN